MASVLCVEIYGLRVVPISLEVARLDGDLAVTYRLHVEECGREAEGEVRAATGTAQVKGALVLNDVCAVALRNEAEGNLVHLLDEVFVDEANALADCYFLERREAFEALLAHAQ